MCGLVWGFGVLSAEGDEERQMGRVDEGWLVVGRQSVALQ
jgi:hypothetical protein